MRVTAQSLQSKENLMKASFQTSLFKCQESNIKKGQHGITLLQVEETIYSFCIDSNISLL